MEFASQLEKTAKAGKGMSLHAPVLTCHGRANREKMLWDGLWGGLVKGVLMGSAHTECISAIKEWQPNNLTVHHFCRMNIFCRSAGGIASDLGGKYFGMRGRLWAYFLLQVSILPTVRLIGSGWINLQSAWQAD